MAPGIDPSPMRQSRPFRLLGGRTPLPPKIAWSGEVVAVQPRIRLTRSFDQRSHTYLGFNLRVRGSLGVEEREFLVGVGKAAQEKHRFKAGDRVRGLGQAVDDDRIEVVDLYKVSKLVVEAAASDSAPSGPPWSGVAPALEEYRRRGHRRLDESTYESSCSTCLWGCRMAVEMIVDQWNPSNRRFRRESFCYGPLSCKLYKAGPPRKVPGRKGMSWTEADWVDQEEVAHRAPDE